MGLPRVGHLTSDDWRSGQGPALRNEKDGRVCVGGRGGGREGKLV